MQEKRLEVAKLQLTKLLGNDDRVPKAVDDILKDYGIEEIIKFVESKDVSFLDKYDLPQTSYTNIFGFPFCYTSLAKSKGIL